MEQRYDSKEKDASRIFLVIDEFAALRIDWDKKEFAEINDSLRRIILMGRAAKHSHYHGVTNARNISIRWSD